VTKANGSIHVGQMLNSIDVFADSVSIFAGRISHCIQQFWCEKHEVRRRSASWPFAGAVE
jgi:hypothetical protein